MSPATEPEITMQRASFEEIWQDFVSRAIERVGSKTKIADEIGVPRPKIYDLGERPHSLRLDALRKTGQLAGATTTEIEEATFSWMRARAATGNFAAALEVLWKAIDAQPPKSREKILRDCLRAYESSLRSKAQKRLDQATS